MSIGRAFALAAALAWVIGAPALRAADKDGFVDTFDVKPENFASVGHNDYFILEPGYVLTYEGKEDGKPSKLVITVTNETKLVDGVKTRVVEEREWPDGKLAEVSRNFFAIDQSTDDVYYFGEDVDEYKDGKISAHGGSWQSGKDGAHYGMFMPAKPQAGQNFYQELAPKVAMDRFEIVSTSENQTVPAGTFTDVLKSKETTPLEPDTVEYKYYAKGVGQIIDGALKLVKYGKDPQAGNGAQTNKKNATGAAGAANADAAGGEPFVPNDVAREALKMVGADPDAEAVWTAAINDPNLTSHQRQDLIEDLNEQGFADPRNVSSEDLPLVMNRIALIEELAPDAMDQVNADAFAEAYKDLTNMADRLTQ